MGLNKLSFQSEIPTNALQFVMDLTNLCSTGPGE